MGRLVANPELKHTSSGKPVTAFTVAVERRKKESGTDFINVIAWDKTAEFICKYFGKGRMIVVEGHIQTRSYKDKEDKMQKVFEIVTESVSFTGDKAPNKEDTQVIESEGFTEMSGDDLPF